MALYVAVVYGVELHLKANRANIKGFKTKDANRKPKRGGMMGMRGEMIRYYSNRQYGLVLLDWKRINAVKQSEVKSQREVVVNRKSGIVNEITTPDS